MNLMRKTLFFLVFLSASLTISAQQLPKTVLWRITGKGLSKPSYLFGTIHLTDGRLFNFGDSVYRAIERTEGLAIELNPDEICAEMMTQIFDEEENNGKKLKDILGEEDFKKYKEALAKKFGKPADEITARDLVNIKNGWVSEMMEKGEMSTFMDAWLYNIARRQGKWLGGIEDMSDQDDLEEELVDKSDIMFLLADDSTQNQENNDMLEKMVKLYLSQDLEGVEAFSNAQSAKEKDLVLVKRNVKMARRMDSLAALRSMFLAVGLAHLPGDSGVIKLLQKRGFKVEPVFSNKKIAAKDYKFKEVKIPWVTVQDDHNLYSVQMPGNPVTKKDEDLVEMKFLFDLFNLSGFCTMAIVNNSMGHKDSMLNKVAEGFLQGKNPSQFKELKRGDLKGREFIQKNEDGHMRLQVFASDNVVYMVLMVSVKETALYSPDAEKFFNSFTANKYVKAPNAANTFTDSVMGLTMQSEFKLKADKKYSPETSKDFKITGFAGSDAAAETFVVLFSREVKPGYYIQSENVTFDDFQNHLSDQYPNLKREMGTLQGYETMTLTGKNAESPDVFVKALSVMKDNRSIILMVISDSAKIFSSSTDMYFNSLRYIEQPAGKWNLQSAPDKSYTVWAPTPLREHLDGDEHFQIAYDTISSTTLFIGTDTLGKYAWYKTDSALWEDYLVKDSKQLYHKETKNGVFAGREMLSKVNGTGKVHTRMRTIVNGNIIYRLFCTAGEKYVNSENVNKFFESFRLQSPKPPAYLQSKAKLLIDDLLSADSATRVGAYNALLEIKFSNEDLPLLKQALLKKYGSIDNDKDDASIIYQLASKLSWLKDPSTIDFIRQQYPAIKEGDHHLKNAMLTALALTRTEKSYAAFTELLLSSVPAKKPYNPVLAALTDSLALSAKFYPQWQKLAGDSIYGFIVADLANILLDSGLIKKELVAGASGEFIKAARMLEQKMKNDPDFFQSWIYDLLSLAGKFNTPEANKLLLDFCAGHFNYLHNHAALLLLKNKQTVPTATFDSLAADKRLRISLYADLKELKKTSLYPKKYFTQESFVEAAIHNLANSEYKASSVEFVQKKKATVEGKTYNFYLYKITYEGEENKTWNYLGVVGGYDVAGKDPEPLKSMADVITTEEFDANRVGELFDIFLKRIEEKE